VRRVIQVAQQPSLLSEGSDMSKRLMRAILALAV